MPLTGIFDWMHCRAKLRGMGFARLFFGARAPQEKGLFFVYVARSPSLRRDGKILILLTKRRINIRFSTAFYEKLSLRVEATLRM